MLPLCNEGLKLFFLTKILVVQCETGFLHPCAMLKQALQNIPYLRVLLRMTCLLRVPELMCPLAQRHKNLRPHL